MVTPCSGVHAISVSNMAWSGEHRAFVVEEFINNSESVILTQRSFWRHFSIGRHDPVLDSKTIRRWVSNFRVTSSALKGKSPGRPRSATGPEMVAAVRVAIHQSPRPFLINSLTTKAKCSPLHAMLVTEMAYAPEQGVTIYISMLPPQLQQYPPQIKEVFLPDPLYEKGRAKVKESSAQEL